MSRPISAWEGLFYYPGSSNDLTRWITRTPLPPPSQGSKQITLYTLVVADTERIVIQLNTFASRPGFRTLETGFKAIRRSVFPRCVIYLDPKVWTVQSHLPLVEINELPVKVALGTLHLGFVDETDHGIKCLGSNANVESFKKMTEKLAKQAMEAAFVEDEEV